MELRIFLGGLRRAAFPAVAFAILGLVVGALLARPTSSQATARTSLLLAPQAGRPSDPAPFIGDPDRYVEDQISILESQPTAAAAAALVPHTLPDDIRTSVSFRQRPRSDVVEVVARSSSPRRSQQLADAVAAAFVNEARAVADEDLKRRFSTIDARLADIRTLLIEVEDRTGDERPSPADAVAQATLLREYDQLQGARLRATEGRDSMREPKVIEPAVVLEREDRRTAALGGGFGFLVAGAIGLGLAAMWAVASGRVPDRRQAEFVLGRPVVADVALEPEPPSLSAAVPEPTERAIVQLAVALAAERPERLPRTVAVGSAVPGVESEAVATALAAVLARESTRVAFVSLDPAHVTPPSEEMPRPSGRERAVGVNGRWTLQRAPAGVDVLVPRQDGKQSVDRHTVDELRKSLEPHADVVVIHLAPLLDSWVAVGIAREVEDFVLVVPAPRQRESELVLIRQVLLEQADRRVHVVLARQSRRANQL